MLKYAYELGVMLAIEEASQVKEAGVGQWFETAKNFVGGLFGKSPVAKKALTPLERFHGGYMEELGKGVDPALEAGNRTYNRYAKGIAEGQRGSLQAGVKPKAKGQVYSVPTGGGVG